MCFTYVFHLYGGVAGTRGHLHAGFRLAASDVVFQHAAFSCQITIWFTACRRPLLQPPTNLLRRGPGCYHGAVRPRDRSNLAIRRQWYVVAVGRAQQYVGVLLRTPQRCHQLLQRGITPLSLVLTQGGACGCPLYLHVCTFYPLLPFGFATGIAALALLVPGLGIVSGALREFLADDDSGRRWPRWICLKYLNHLNIIIINCSGRPGLPAARSPHQFC